MLDRLEAGDVLVVTKLDRLGRQRHGRGRDRRQARGNSACGSTAWRWVGVDLTSSTGKLTMAVINAVAEFERDLLVERTQAGLSRARAEGRRLGRPAQSHRRAARGGRAVNSGRVRACRPWRGASRPAGRPSCGSGMRPCRPDRCGPRLSTHRSKDVRGVASLASTVFQEPAPRASASAASKSRLSAPWARRRVRNSLKTVWSKPVSVSSSCVGGWAIG